MEGAGGHGLSSPVRAGVLAAVITLIADQASKLWLLHILDIAHHAPVTVTPFFDLVLAMNPGISFGWFQSETPAAQILLMVIKAAAVIALAIWMARSRTWLATVSLGLIIGGAIGNVIDRQVHGHVVDFIQWYVGSYTWPSFNIADSAIVVGAIGIALFGLFDGKSAKKADNANPKP